ncbi:MAG: MBL fold metallo-hydrolase [Zoogloeaceae bacterium]|nr:MBL fold metallo-hydrolase [Zoogloeaceae bacterium]
MGALPTTLQVLERGWLSANNILGFDGDEVTVIDSGYVDHAPQTVALVGRALGGRRLTRLLNTHSHSDHVGGNAALAAAFGCAIHVPEGMAAWVARWDEAALLLSVADQRGARFSVDETFVAGDRLVFGELEWTALAAPGHDDSTLIFHNPDRRILISADALWRDGFGILFSEILGAGGGLAGARRTLDALARLPLDWVIPGHGAPFREVDEALAAAYARLRAFEEDGARMARNALRGCVTFRLLSARQVTLAWLAEHLEEVPLYQRANRAFLHQPADRLAVWLAGELERAGVVRREGETLVVL